MLGVPLVLAADDRVGQVHLERFLAPLPARAEHVQADARHHRGQPAAEVLHAPGVRQAEAQPGLLYGVLGLADRAEHPVGHRSQTGAMFVELLHRQTRLVHLSHSFFARVHNGKRTEPSR
ncbi:hypothetical protein GCM10020216_054940 [Nonomuraea helvata]